MNAIETMQTAVAEQCTSLTEKAVKLRKAAVRLAEALDETKGDLDSEERTLADLRTQIGEAAGDRDRFSTITTAIGRRTARIGVLNVEIEEIAKAVAKAEADAKNAAEDCCGPVKVAVDAARAGVEAEMRAAFEPIVKLADDFRQAAAGLYARYGVRQTAATETKALLSHPRIWGVMSDPWMVPNHVGIDFTTPPPPAPAPQEAVGDTIAAPAGPPDQAPIASDPVNPGESPETDRVGSPTTDDPDAGRPVGRPLPPPPKHEEPEQAKTDPDPLA